MRCLKPVVVYGKKYARMDRAGQRANSTYYRHLHLQKSLRCEGKRRIMEMEMSLAVGKTRLSGNLHRSQNRRERSRKA